MKSGCTNMQVWTHARGDETGRQAGAIPTVPNLGLRIPPPLHRKKKKRRKTQQLKLCWGILKLHETLSTVVTFETTVSYILPWWWFTVVIFTHLARHHLTLSCGETCFLGKTNVQLRFEQHSCSSGLYTLLRPSNTMHTNAN